MNATAQPNVDRVASMLGQLGRIARGMPPAWDGAKITQLATGPQGEVFGKVLPGRGLALTRDLKTLGITKPIPHVYERSRTGRLIDYWQQRAPSLLGRTYYDPHLKRICRPDPEILALKTAAALAGIGLAGGHLDLSHLSAPLLLGAITSYNGIINARANGKGDETTVAKNSITTVANQWSSLFRVAGQPGAGSYTNIPGSTFNRTSAGAWTLGTPSPTGGDKKYLLTWGMGALQNINWYCVVDLLVAAGNVLATTAAAQTINTPALTRYTTGAGVMITLEVTTQTSATAHNVTVNSYTDQDGTTGNTTGAQTAQSGAVANIVNQLVPRDTGSPFFSLASGDYGVRAVAQVTISAALAAGVYALNMIYPLSWMPGIASGTYVERDMSTQIDSLTELVTDGTEIGCLTVFVMTNTTSTGVTTGFYRTCRG